ncbi:restriction endonuclease subunit S [Campylobacter upsaliensis]|uniref:restriction endonuclease subunit S n=1 Tax=Campylobacter upsaliensis TaxID=28080 RepID=UPI0022EB1766|nr:restriction endonuclease subunit S [Campylobacter upsaliensis]MEB2801601.1 restriction endonuclease subunit S [Campylobacter upsaliensis]MEB2825807.1 restriction endonuclease subunit S [Campylobacter upsaliensis]
MSSVKIVRFKDLSLWSFALQESRAISSKYQLSTLKEVLINLTNERKFIIDDNAFYAEPTISSKTNEISVSRQGLGKIFKVKSRIKILEGDLVISKMHTQNGLFAFAKQEFASTTTFVPFQIKDKLINPNFLFVLLKPTLSRLMKFDSVKRETYKIEEILNLQIPLPPLEIQNEIINKLKALEDKIKALQEEKAKLENEINEYIYIALGLEKRGQILNQTGVKIVRYKDLKLFDYKSNALEKSELKSTYKRYQFSDFLTRRLDKIKIDENTFYKRVTIKTKAQGCHLRDTLKGNLIKTKNQFLIKDGQFLISKIDARNGAFGIAINDLDKAVIMADFLNYDIDKNIINDKFLIAVLKTPYYMEQLDSLSSGTTGRKRINEQKFSNLCISLPPLKIQNELMLKLTEVDEKIENLSKEFSDLKNEMIEGLL